MSRAEQAHVNESAGEGREKQFATFVVDNLLFGVEVVRVQEVLRYQEMTPVPNAAEVIEGLINLRGQIVTAIDVRRRLGLKPRDSGRMPMNMVVRSDDGAVSLLVDEIGDVLDVERAAFESVPDNAPAGIRDLTTGIYKLKDRLLLILDTGKTIDVSTSSGRQRPH